MTPVEHFERRESFSLNRALDDAFSALKLAPLPLWLGAFLVTVSDGCPPGLPPLLPGSDLDHSTFSHWRDVFLRMSSGSADAEHAAILSWIVGGMLIVAALVLASLLLNAFLQTGFLRLHEHLLVHAEASYAPLWSGSDRFLAMLGYKLAAGVLTVVATIVAAGPGALLAFYGFIRHQRALIESGLVGGVVLALGSGLYVGLGVYLGELAVVFERASPLDALRRSFALAEGLRLRLFGFAFGCFVIHMVSLLGLLLCCIGALSTVPFARAWTGFAKTESFLLLTRGHVASEGWALWRQKAHAGGHTSGPVQGWGEPPRDPPA